MAAGGYNGQMNPAADYCVVLTTAANADEAARLADGLVAARLAACVQSQPINSTYVWEGAVQHDAEVLLLIKTRSDAYAAIEAFIREHHSYDVPEIICLPVTAGSSDYLGWISQTLKER